MTMDEVPRALVVEDDRAWQQILREILTDIGLTVDADDVVDAGDAAVARLRAAPHRLAVVDLALGGGEYANHDGLRVLDAVQRLDPGCASILLTGFATVELAVDALTQHGAFHCLRKEAFDRAEFRALVRRALASPPALRAGESSPAPSPASPAPGVALVVEDDAGWRAILAELLQDAGYTARLCNSFGEALGCLRRETFALAVVDLSLGEAVAQELDGYQLLNCTRSHHIPTIVVSGVGDAHAIERVYEEQGVFGYLEKQTFDRRAFLRTVAEAEASRAVGDALAELTERELEVLAALAQGLTNKEIGAALVISPNTVKRHLRAIYAKLDVHTRAAATAKAVSAGIAGIPEV
jgi:DNA-binding NarL/FixJ family response regulator